MEGNVRVIRSTPGREQQIRAKRGVSGHSRIRGEVTQVHGTAKGMRCEDGKTTVVETVNPVEKEGIWSCAIVIVGAGRSNDDRKNDLKAFRHQIQKFGLAANEVQRKVTGVAKRNAYEVYGPDEALNDFLARDWPFIVEWTYRVNARVGFVAGGSGAEKRGCSFHGKAGLTIDDKRTATAIAERDAEEGKDVLRKFALFEYQPK